MDILLFEISAVRPDLVKKEAENLYNILQNNTNNTYKVFSPKSPFIEKINNKFRVNIIIKCKISSLFLKIIYEKLNEYDRIRKKEVNISITKNPIYIG